MFLYDPFTSVFNHTVDMTATKGNCCSNTAVTKVTFWEKGFVIKGRPLITEVTPKYASLTSINKYETAVISSFEVKNYQYLLLTKQNPKFNPNPNPNPKSRSRD